MYTFVYAYIYIYRYNKFSFVDGRRGEGLMYAWLVSDSAPTWASRCCFTACHF